jgi:hypothetical protein
MSEEYVELILQWSARTDKDRVRDWLRQRGIGFTEMQTGLLIFGNRGLLDQHLSVSLEDIRPPAQVPIPPPLQNDVTSIMLPSPRRPHV